MEDKQTHARRNPALATGTGLVNAGFGSAATIAPGRIKDTLWITHRCANCTWLDLTIGRDPMGSEVWHDMRFCTRPGGGLEGARLADARTGQRDADEAMKASLVRPAKPTSTRWVLAGFRLQGVSTKCRCSRDEPDAEPAEAAWGF